MENIQKNKKKPNPRNAANIFSIITFGYTIPIFREGFRRDINENDITEHRKCHASQKLGNKLENVWQKEVHENNDPSLFKAIFKVFGMQFILLGILLLILELVVRLSQPLALSQLIMYYTRNNEITLNEAYFYASVIVISSLLNVILSHIYMYQMQQLGMKLRVACSSIIYRKSLKLTKTALRGTTVGQAVNLLSNDLSRCDHALMAIHSLWICPIEIVLIVGILYAMTGATSAVGVLFMVVFVPFQMYLGKKTSTFHLKIALKRDDRIGLMSEIIAGMQIIKMYTWEKPFSKLVATARKLEIIPIRGSSYIRGIILSFAVFLTRFAIFLTILTYVLIGNKLAAEYVFVVSSFYNIFRQVFTMHLPMGFSNFAEFRVSINRLKKFLLYNEVDIDKRNVTHNSSNIAVSIENATTKWSEDSSNNTLNNVNLKFNNNEIIALIGPVGCGKTSLLHVILKELPLQRGKLEINGTVSYASQEPWVFEGSVKQNILFGQPFIEQKYREVTQVCALSRDFSEFQYGDETLVGERGVMLSGGQKARIGLARAIYKEADIYLLDDPLSAVDTHVGKQLFEECIENYLKNKCIILVTHQLQFLNKVKKIFLIENGSITNEGTYDEIKNLNLEFTKQFQNNKGPEESSGTGEAEENEKLLTEKETSAEVPIVNKEERSSGTIKSLVYGYYLRAGGSIIFSISVFLLFILSQLAASSSDYFITYWVNLEQKLDQNIASQEETLSRETCIYIYTGIIASMVVLTLLRSFTFFSFCMKASTNLHNNMFCNIVKSPMTFFNTNSSGRILNRFSQDMGSVDQFLPMIAIDFFQIALTVAGVAIIVSIVNPWLLIATGIILLLFYLMRIVYIRTSSNVQRLQGITKSPIFAHMTASLQGLTTIRAFSAQAILEKEFDSHQDVNSSVNYLIIICSESFGLWVDIVTVIYITVITFSFFMSDSEQYGGNVGLAITQAISLSGIIQWGIKQWAALETQSTSVERIVEYTKIEPEFDPNEIVPLPSWSAQGNINFSSVSLRYSSSNPYVLKNLNFKIESNEKIGVVGRTGAGKSSLVNAIFQLVKTQGIITIDNINISKIPLQILRSKISIIPQQPMLFSATIKKNLDPFDEYDDKELWDALEQVELKNVVAELPLTLHYKVSESGSNFSVGQRQLLCLARAIIRKNKILILDEATANVDPQTDSLIQKTIRTKFSDCTVLTIAHRLNTIMDSDKVLVMNYGEAIEFDHPHLLLQDKNSVFYSMLQQTGSSTVKTLSEIAENSTASKKLWPTKYNI